MSDFRSEPQKFTGDIMWVACSQIVISLFGLLTLPALSKSYGVDLYGVWAQILVTRTFVSGIISLQLETAVVRYLAAENDKVKLRHSFGSMLLAILFLVLLSIILAALTHTQLAAGLFGSADYSTPFFLACIWGITTGVFNFFVSYFRSRRRMKFYSLTMLTTSIIQLIMVYTLSLNNTNLSWLILWQFILEIFSISLLLLVIARENGMPIFGWGELPRYLNLSFPHILNVNLLWIILSSDRYLITYFLGLSQTGVFSATYSIAGVIALFYTPITFVLFPTISNFWEHKEVTRVKTYLEYSTKLFLGLAIPGIVGLYLLSPLLIRLLATAEFVTASYLTLLMCISVLFLGIYNINLYVLFLLERTRWIPLIVGAGAGTSIISNLLLIPYIGLTGAAISKVISFFLLAGVVVAWAHKSVGYSFDLHYTMKVCLASGLMGLTLKAMLFMLKGASIFQIALLIILGLASYLLGAFSIRLFTSQDRAIIHNIVVGYIRPIRQYGQH